MEIDLCPRWLLRKFGISADAQPHLSLFLSSFFVVLLSPIWVRLPHICLMRTLFGLPCPGCGVLHGMRELCRMNVGAAWNSNPAVFLVVSLLLFQLVARPMALASEGIRPVITKLSHRSSYLVTVSLLVVWTYRLTMGGIHGVGILP